MLLRSGATALRSVSSLQHPALPRSVLYRASGIRRYRAPFCIGMLEFETS